MTKQNASTRAVTPSGPEPTGHEPAGQDRLHRSVSGASESASMCRPQANSAMIHPIANHRDRNRSAALRSGWRTWTGRVDRHRPARLEQAAQVGAQRGDQREAQARGSRRSTSCSRASALGLLACRADPDDIPRQMRALERGDQPRPGIELPPPESVRADVGNAWWLLCHASPNASGASQARLRD